MLQCRRSHMMRLKEWWRQPSKSLGALGNDITFLWPYPKLAHAAQEKVGHDAFIGAVMPGDLHRQLLLQETKTLRDTISKAHRLEEILVPTQTTPLSTDDSPGRDGGRRDQGQPVHPHLDLGTRCLTPGHVHTEPRVVRPLHTPVLWLWTVEIPASPMPSNHHPAACKHAAPALRKLRGARSGCPACGECGHFLVNCPPGGGGGTAARVLLLSPAPLGKAQLPRPPEGDYPLLQSPVAEEDYTLL
ncbi:UNVERIFIED_CONTAM: hypothetical protein FKN15_067072 [Acipenser sinensis]